MPSVKRSDLQTALAMAIVGAAAGGVYARLAYVSRPDAIGTVMLGIGLGLLIGGGIGLFETLWVAKPNSRIRQMRFGVSILIRAIVYTFIILFSRIIAQTVYGWITSEEVRLIGQSQRETLTDIGFSITLASVLIFFMQMRNYIGARTFRNLMIGRYNQPRLEERVFLILDVVGSTALAQRIGDIRFHKYLNRIFVLADEPISDNKGEVHSYVGDAIFAIWPVRNTRDKNARALKAMAGIDAIIREHRDDIEKEFGVAPEIRMAVHRGPVVAGETGHRKRQITYLGNTVNVASRIEALTKSGIGTYLASMEYLNTVDLPANIDSEPLGDFEIKGSETKIGLSRLTVKTV